MVDDVELVEECKEFDVPEAKPKCEIQNKGEIKNKFSFSFKIFFFNYKF